MLLRKWMLMGVILFGAQSVLMAQQQEEDWEDKERLYKTITPRKINFGISEGVGGLHHLFKPVLELKLYNFSLRGTYGFDFLDYGLDAELFQFQSGFFNKVLFSKNNSLMLGVGQNHQYATRCDFQCIEEDLTDRYGAWLGLRTYVHSHMTLAYKAGAAYERTSYHHTVTGLHREETSWVPFGEISFTYYFLAHQGAE